MQAELNLKTGGITWKHADGSVWLEQNKADLTRIDVVHYNTGGEKPIINRVKTVDGERNFIQNLKAEKVRDGYRARVFFDWKELTEVLADKVTVFMGQTGAGKTTLLNLIAPGMNLATGETSDKLGRGRHTTRHVEFFEVASGLIADTPGFSNLDYDVSNQPDLNAAFPEILRESHGCKFRECTHTHEPSCAVKEALEEGRILASRYENYLQLLTEINNTRETYAKQRKKQN